MTIYVGSTKVGPCAVMQSIGVPREITSQGVFQRPSSNFTLTLPSDAATIGTYAMAYSFFSSTGLVSIELPNVSSVNGSSAMACAFARCTALTSINFAGLQSIRGEYALNEAFAQCTALTSVNFQNLTTITGGDSPLYQAFKSCSNLTSMNFPSLSTLTGYFALRWTFQSCSNLGSISFPSLNSNSFGSYTNQFNGMLSGVTGCTVHFPSNLQSVIGSWSDVTAGFGGTNTTVLFDLPATT